MKIYLSILVFLSLIGQSRGSKYIDNKVKFNYQIFGKNLSTSVYDFNNSILVEQDTNDFSGPNPNVIQIGRNTLLLKYVVKTTTLFCPIIKNSFLQNLLIDLPPPQIS